MFWEVIISAFRDIGVLFGAGMHNVRVKPDTKRASANWLLKDLKDFPFVCDMAGADPAVIREAARKVMLGELGRERVA